MTLASRLSDDIRKRWSISDHARERMELRNISIDDIAEALWNFNFFEYGHSFALNLWGYDLKGRKLRVTIVPEARHIETVALFHQWTLGDYLQLKAKQHEPK